LGGVVGRAAGSTAFGYSKAMKNSGITWTPKHLFAYVTNPGKHIPGNKMSFAGISA
jgi:cytochrome c